MTNRGRFRQFCAVALSALVLSGSGSAADALPPLRENQHINDSLLAAAIGDRIRKKCPEISARMFTVIRKASDLERYALSLGYTEAQIEAFIDSEAEQKRMKALRDDYLARNGVVKNDPATYCRLGRQEIARGTLTGSLLRQR